MLGGGLGAPFGPHPGGEGTRGWLTCSALPPRLVGGAALQQQRAREQRPGLGFHVQRGHGEDTAGRPARVRPEQLQELALRQVGAHAEPRRGRGAGCRSPGSPTGLVRRVILARPWPGQPARAARPGLRTGVRCSRGCVIPQAPHLRRPTRPQDWHRRGSMAAPPRGPRFSDGEAGGASGLPALTHAIPAARLARRPRRIRTECPRPTATAPEKRTAPR